MVDQTTPTPTGLTDTQKIDEILREVLYLKDGFHTLCNATQDIVDKLQPPGIPTRPKVEPQSQPTPQPQRSTPTQNQTAPNQKTLEDIQRVFPVAIAAKLDFAPREQGTKVWIKPKEFLGSQLFSEVNGIVRSMGGQYVSAGKDSHFEVPLARSA